MFSDFFKKKAKVVKINPDGSQLTFDKKNKFLIFIIIGAICILTFGSCGDLTEPQKKVTETIADENMSEYTKNIEQRLNEMLSTIKGAGRVETMVMFESGEEKVLATDKKRQLESEKAEDGNSNQSTDEEKVLVLGSGAEGKPFVLKERVPTPSGVFVTATGAESETVRLEIYEAVKALFGISGHRIKVSAMEK